MPSDSSACAASGSATSGNNIFTVGGSGTDVWGTADEFRFVYRQLKPGVRYWGDKNPHYASPDTDGCLQTIVDLFPDVSIGYIGLERDHATAIAAFTV